MIISSFQNEAVSLCQVLSSLKVKRRVGASADTPLSLDAEDLALNKISINGRELSGGCVLCQE